jgi:hypothetical protein
MIKIFKILFSLYIFTFFLIITLNLKVQKNKSVQDFSLSCINLFLWNYTLEAYCLKLNGTYNFTSINLNKCLTNWDGSLRRGTNYSKSCFDCFTDRNFLKCICLRMDGRNYRSIKDMNEFLTNKDGILTC